MRILWRTDGYRDLCYSMNITVVSCLPDPNGLVTACTRTVCDALSSHSLDLVDLAADGFVPTMTSDERHAYFTDEPIRDPLIARYAEYVNRADALIFVFRSAWCGLPALTKGWLEKVMVPGVAFGFNDHGTVEPRLHHVRRIAGVAIHEDSAQEVRSVVDGGRRTLLRALRVSAGLRTRTSWYALHNVSTLDIRRQEMFLARLQQGFTRW